MKKEVLKYMLNDIFDLISVLSKLLFSFIFGAVFILSFLGLLLLLGADFGNINHYFKMLCYICFFLATPLFMMNTIYEWYQLASSEVSKKNDEFDAYKKSVIDEYKSKSGVYK